jgi:hypothetical protein
MSCEISSMRRRHGSMTASECQHSRGKRGMVPSPSAVETWIRWRDTSRRRKSTIGSDPFRRSIAGCWKSSESSSTSDIYGDGWSSALSGRMIKRWTGFRWRRFAPPPATVRRASGAFTPAGLDAMYRVRFTVRIPSRDTPSARQGIPSAQSTVSRKNRSHDLTQNSRAPRAVARWRASAHRSPVTTNRSDRYLRYPYAYA